MAEGSSSYDPGAPARRSRVLAAPAYNRAIRTPGMMRCCAQTIRETASMTEIGDRLKCAYANGDRTHWVIVAADGCWEWDQSLGGYPQRESSP